MARCTNDTLLNKIGAKKYTKRTEVTFNVLEDIDRCVRVNARNPINVIASSTEYSQFRIPEDRFNCDPRGCRNTGTLMLTGTADGTVSARYTVPYDATEFYAGLVTYYAYFPEAGTYTVTTSISSIRDASMTNKDTYEQEITVTEAGFRPIIINFEDVPTGTTGSGWQADEAGALIEVLFHNENATAIIEAGISSFYFYDSVEDLQVNDVVKIACLTDISADLTIDASDATCFGSEYDPDSAAIEYTITGKFLTPNFDKLNPMRGDTQDETGWLIANDEREVQSTVINGVTYGYIQIPDVSPDECGFVGVQIAELCNVTDSQLERVNSPIPIGISANQYIVLDGTITDPNDIGMILFNEELIGQDVIVSYPQHTEARVTVFSDENINNVRVRMYIPYNYTDCTESAYLFENVLITSFPMGQSSTADGEMEFSFTISVQRDKDGNFFKKITKTENF